MKTTRVVRMAIRSIANTTGKMPNLVRSPLTPRPLPRRVGRDDSTKGFRLVAMASANSTEKISHSQASGFQAARLTPPSSALLLPNSRTRKQFQPCTVSRTCNFCTPMRGNLVMRPYSSCSGSPVHPTADESDKVTMDDPSQPATMNVCRTNSQLKMSKRSSVFKWLTPISEKLLMRCYSSQGLAIATSVRSDNSDSNQHTHMNDFNWHAHMASGSFLYKGLTLNIRIIGLQEYSLKNPMLEMRPIYGDPHGKCSLFVIDVAKVHTWQLINSLSEFHRIGLCIVDLDHTKVLMCDGIPKFSPEISFAPATDNLVKENYVKLEKIIRGTLFQGKPLPYGMNHLLRIMRTEPLESVALMKCHVALVRQVHKTAFFLRMYDFIDALRLTDPLIWSIVLSYLPYKFVWLKIMLQNRLLFAGLMRKREGNLYTPAEEIAYLLKQLSKKKSEPAKQMRTYRSLSVHKMDDSVDPVTEEIMYTEQMFEDILDSELPRYKVDMQYGLHMVGRLELAQLDSFFGLTVSVGTYNVEEMIAKLDSFRRT